MSSLHVRLPGSLALKLKDEKGALGKPLLLVSQAKMISGPGVLGLKDNHTAHQVHTIK